MQDLYILCGGCKHYRRDRDDCLKQFEEFPHGRIPDPVATGRTKKGDIPPCWEP